MGDGSWEMGDESELKVNPRNLNPIREMGGAPRNLAPRNHFLAWIVKPSGRPCTDGHLTSRAFTEDFKKS